jgi:hypothetical protein
MAKVKICLKCQRRMTREGKTRQRYSCRNPKCK